MIREINYGDYQQLMELYTHLHEKDVTPFESAKSVWEQIISDPNYHIIVAEENGRIVSSCTCIIIPNLTHGPRPYAWVENVVTHADYRGKGFATKCLDYVKALAEKSGCYRLVLMTGSKLETTLKFYENAGYDRQEKTGFIQHLD